MGIRAVVFDTGTTTQPWRFRVIAGNNEIIASSEGYARKQSAEDTARLITDNVEVVEFVPKVAHQTNATGEVRTYHEE